MDQAIAALVAAIHNSRYQMVLAVSGGGSTAASQLLTVPGASRTILEVTIPYGTDSFAGYLGRIPQSFCSVTAARALAARSLERARWLAPGASVIGAGCTASLRSERPKLGDHRFHFAFQTDRCITTYSGTLIKGARTREAEEEVVAATFLNGLAEACGVAQQIPNHFLPGEELSTDRCSDSPLAEFLSGARPGLCVEADGCIREPAAVPQLLLSGSFNPLHHGHVSLAAIASSSLGKPIAFEMTVTNADKPPLEDAEIRRRIAQFSWRARLFLTRAATFAEKARLFSGVSFVVGADTAARIVDPRFYGQSEQRRARELAEFRSLGCQFVVAGRSDAEGTFITLEDLVIPESLRDLFVAIPEESFRHDISSTQIRSASGR